MDYIIPLIMYVIVPIFLFVLFRFISSKTYNKFIPFLREKKMGQIIRKEGVEAHLSKEGTPTMGGIVFGIYFILFGSLYTLYKTFTGSMRYETKYIPLLCVFTMTLMFLGYKDDIRKIILKNTKGLSANKKLLFQILFSFIFVILVYYLRLSENVKAYINIPIYNSFFDIKSIDYTNISMMILIIAIDVFILVGTQNGANFTDGLDSLLCNVTIVISIFYIIFSFLAFYINLFVVNIVMLSLLLSFRKYNVYPAKIFMGDTGSLFLGAYVGGMAILLEIQYYLPIFAFIYMIEVISVILQVSYFKITKGKRIFKMAPIHHHFEKCGYSEKKIVFMFTTITICMCILSFILMIL